MKKRAEFMVDSGLMTVSLVTGSFLFIISITMLIEGRLLPAALFFAIGINFFYEMVRNGKVVSFEKTGISKKLLGKKCTGLNWENVVEVGVVGTKVFNQKKPEKTGRLYLYASDKKLSDEERFDMILNWPPRNLIYTLYQDDKIECLRMVWSGKIETYNVGDLQL